MYYLKTEDIDEELISFDKYTNTSNAMEVHVVSVEDH